MSRMVSETIWGEGSLLILSFLFGIVLMLLYDILRIFRQLYKHGTILLAIEDVLYWLICGVGVFAMLYQENEGLVRWFVLGGVTLGMLTENTFVSPWVIRLFVRVLRVWLDFLGKVFQIVEKPAKKFSHIFKKQLKKLRKAIKIGIGKE